MMKQTIKSLLPLKLKRKAIRLYANARRRRYPRYDSYYNISDRVLQCRISYNKYGAYCLPLESLHRFSVQNILHGNVHEPKTIQLMQRLSSSGDVVHAGAYFGDFLPALSYTLPSNTYVWAFEPHPVHYRCARITIELNDIRNVVIHNLGLSDSDNNKSLIITNYRGEQLGGKSHIDTSCHTASDNAFSANHKEIMTVQLDRVLPADRHVSVIHLDTEGHEQLALDGAMETIKRCLPILIVETCPEEEWLSENLYPLDYKLVKTIEANSIFVSQSSRLNDLQLLN